MEYEFRTKRLMNLKIYNILDFKNFNIDNYRYQLNVKYVFDKCFLRLV